jgi:HK97 family phage major capsid protein
MEAITELRATVEQVKSDGLDEVKVKNIEKFLDEQEEKNQKITAELLARQKAEAELKEKLEKAETEHKARIDQMERLLSRPGSGLTKGDGQTDESKAFLSFVTKGEKDMGADEVKYLRTNSDTEGGFLVPTQYAHGSGIFSGVFEIYQPIEF